ncbi:hypothetical protein HN385_05345 [archaeon]|jgi:hypothetical protein|nr:hypothetical protein [archaeon]MBT3451499.1 hypothetical protein [archaeon]MBT6869492.1 hypothetical protein [archaeon]MBT7193180.1 hypothetical protein [archaeon]MBT7380486.1 hypothetical protein [archaeon]
MAIEKKWMKIVYLTLMVLVAAGFTLPGIMYFGGGSSDSNTVTVGNDRICSTDIECYLTCEGELKASLCYQNLCEINNCNEESNYDSEGFTFNLNIEISGEHIDLSERSSEYNIFAEFSEISNTGNEVNIHTDFLSMNQILEKVGMGLSSQCITIDGTTYCRSDSYDLTFTVNGEESYSYGNVVPEEGDVIKITFT